MRDEHRDEPRSERRMSLFEGALWTFVQVFVVNLAVLLTEGARPGAQDDVVNVTACQVLAYSAVIFAMLRIYAPDASLREVLGARATSPFALVLAGAGGVALYPALDLIDTFVSKRFPPTPEETERLGRLIHATTTGERLALFASAVVALPLFEELFFRGAVFRGLRRGRPEGLAVLWSAVLYGLSPGNLKAMPTTFILGLFTSWLRGRSGSIAAPIVANAAYAALPITLIARGKGDVDLGARLAVEGALAAAVCAWGAGMIYRRDARAERGRLLDG